MDQFPQAPDYTPLGPFLIFRKFAEIFAAKAAPLLLLTPVIGGKWKKFAAGAVIPAAVLPAVSLIPVVHLDLRISPQIFGKILNAPSVIFRGLGEDDS